MTTTTTSIFIVTVFLILSITAKPSSKFDKVPRMKEEFRMPEVEEETEDFVGPMTNPAASYLDGGSFENVKSKCTLIGCSGPIPNDGSYSISNQGLTSACNQMFVPLNSCTNNKGYPMGMLCSICCDCTNSFAKEMKKTFGYKTGIDTSLFTL